MKPILFPQSSNWNRMHWLDDLMKLLIRIYKKVLTRGTQDLAASPRTSNWFSKDVSFFQHSTQKRFWYQNCDTKFVSQTKFVTKSFWSLFGTSYLHIYCCVKFSSQQSNLKNIITFLPTKTFLDNWYLFLDLPGSCVHCKARLLYFLSYNGLGI